MVAVESKQNPLLFAVPPHVEIFGLYTHGTQHFAQSFLRALQGGFHILGHYGVLYLGRRELLRLVLFGGFDSFGSALAAAFLKVLAAFASAAPFAAAKGTFLRGAPGFHRRGMFGIPFLLYNSHYGGAAAYAQKAALFFLYYCYFHLVASAPKLVKTAYYSGSYVFSFRLYFSSCHGNLLKGFSQPFLQY